MLGAITAQIIHTCSSWHHKNNFKQVSLTVGQCTDMLLNLWCRYFIPTTDRTIGSETTGYDSCRYNCGGHSSGCSCDYNCRYYGTCCHDFCDHCSHINYGYCSAYSTPSAVTHEPSTTTGSCRYNCGGYSSGCSCNYNCGYYGNCCPDFCDQCSYINYGYCGSPTTAVTPEPSTTTGSCRYNCGGYSSGCSCNYNCGYYGNCCPDFCDQCSYINYGYCGSPTTAVTPEPSTTTGSCRYNCGGYSSGCSCNYNCGYYGNCCPDFCDQCSYINYGYCGSPTTAVTPEPSTTTGSCRYNCGGYSSGCSCNYNCGYYGNCCPDFCDQCSYINYGYCGSPTTAVTPEPSTTTGSCRYNCGGYSSGCSCNYNCGYYGNCCPDFCDQCSYINYGYCGSPTTAVTPEPSTTTGSCRYNCGGYSSGCSCNYNCGYYGNCCPDFCDQCSYINYGYCGSPTTAVTPEPSTTTGSCRYNCGGYSSGCSCNYNCGYYGNCCPDFCDQCSYINYGYCGSPTTAVTPEPSTTTGSCRYNCGGYSSGCSCNYNCGYYGNCCPDFCDQCSYINYGYCGSPTTAVTPEPSTTTGSCRYNCGGYSSGCSCNYNCGYYGNCCPDFCDQCSYINYGYCGSPTTAVTTEPSTTTGSCRYNCGGYSSGCSCDYNCRYNGNCCHDFCDHCSYINNGYCGDSTTDIPEPAWTTGYTSCRYNCGGYSSGCSCDYNCRYNGNCCHDFCDHCSYINNGYCSAYSTPSGDAARTTNATGGSCGGYLGGANGSVISQGYPYSYLNNARCTWYIRVNRNQTIKLEFTDIDLEVTSTCSYDYIAIYDGPSTNSILLSKICHGSNQTFKSSSNSMTIFFRSDSSVTRRGFTANYYSLNDGYGSCKYNCGEYSSGCSCDYNCDYYGNCCPDFCDHCSYMNNGYCSANTTTEGYGSCRYNCGEYSSGCSCDYNCGYNGNCCYDFCDHCSYINNGHCNLTAKPTHGSCGGYHESVFGSIISQGYPYSYPNNARCTWYIRVDRNQRIKLKFTDIDLEVTSNCSFDYIAIYDGPSTNSILLSKICHGSNQIFTSSSNSMTIFFSSDSSITRRGFTANYYSLLINDDMLTCSTYYMEAKITMSYLKLLGFNQHYLYLNDRSCRPIITANDVVFKIPLNRCGTVWQGNNGSITYSNTIRSSSSDSVITRERNLQINIGCEMQQDTMFKIMYVTKDDTKDDITESGMFNVSMTFFHSSSFTRPVLESPYYVDLRQDMFLQVNLHSSDTDLVVFVDTCTASPYRFNGTSRTYDLIKNGCKRDVTYNAYPSPSNGVARFKFSAFKFMNLHPSVYLQCKLVVCKAYDYSSRCYRGCLSRQKRATSSSKGSTNVLIGPIELKKNLKYDEATGLDKEVDEADETTIQSSLPFALSLLVLVAAVSGLVVTALKLHRSQQKECACERM
uniref:scavenger receptor cysteine-rich domain-containing protein DMBT1-like isoform X2 n=1 Tax=Pristiophorus japonicus TaxID=55135 RepID=UPI00398EF8D3